jgi:hypothetical protein
MTPWTEDARKLSESLFMVRRYMPTTILEASASLKLAFLMIESAMMT